MLWVYAAGFHRVRLYSVLEEALLVLQFWEAQVVVARIAVDIAVGIAGVGLL